MYVCTRVNIYINSYLYVCTCNYVRYAHISMCGVATIGRHLKIMCFCCRIFSLLEGSFAKETCNFKEPTNRSHPIQASVCDRGEN